MLQMGLVSFAAPFPTLVLMESKGTSVRERATAFNAALAMADDRVRTGAERLTADAPDGIGAVGAAGALPSPVWRRRQRDQRGAHRRIRRGVRRKWQLAQQSGGEGAAGYAVPSRPSTARPSFRPQSVLIGRIREMER
jgi:hypothetical protein